MSSRTAELPGYLPGDWRIDPKRSTLKFSIGHLGFHTVHGTLAVSGEFVIADEPEGSSVSAVIDLETVDTRSQRRDKAARSPSLLDVDKYPSAYYRSTAVMPAAPGSDAPTFVLEGELTLVGVTRPVALDISLQESTLTDGLPCPVIAGRGRFARRDFGLVYRTRPQFLDRAIASTIDVELTMRGLPATPRGLSLEDRTNTH
jgi:polyisoprenoid-binding protein YceI